MSKPLFDDTDEGENDADFKLSTNKEYAKVYNDYRKKELLKKFKDRGYNNIDIDEEDSESSSSDEEEDEELNVQFDREFFKTLASLKSKDPSIYDQNTRFFTSLDDDTKIKSDEKASNKSKPVTLKDYERKVILEHGGKFEDSDEEHAEGYIQRSESPTAVEEERRLKAEFQKALNTNESEDEEFGAIFKKRVKTNEEKKQEEEDFAEWLAGKKADIEAQAKEKLEPLKNYWNQKNLPQSERFLRDYILNKGYCNTKSNDIPTYDEIVGDDCEMLSEDEKELEKQAEFEEKYNFRFEEPDAEFIKRFPRTIENSVRLDAGKRKEKRQELKKRKQDEKEQKMKELEMLKEIKRKEIQEKIEKLKKVTGNEELGFNDAELEEDFDPEAHDRRMQELFNEEYYEVDEGEEKPECPSDIEELKIEDWDNYDPSRIMNGDNDDDYELHCEDEDFNMDCDYDPEAAKKEFQQELIDNTKRRKNRRGRRNRFMEMIQQEKPPFDPEDEKTYGEYIEEYYKLDCEDIIADIPCRFKYVETTPNDFGLTIEEILLAKNKELNQWASLKKTLQIRPEQVEKRDQRLYKLKAKNEDLKRKIFKSLYGDNSDDDNEDEAQETNNTIETSGSQTAESKLPANNKKSKKKRKFKKSAEGGIDNKITLTESKEPETETQPTGNDDPEMKPSNDNSSTGVKKKRKKKKKKKTIASEVTTSSNIATKLKNEKDSNPSKNTNITDNISLVNSTDMKKPNQANPFNNKRDNKSNAFENKNLNTSQKMDTNATQLANGNENTPTKRTKTIENVTDVKKPKHSNPFNNKSPNKTNGIESKKPKTVQKTIINAAQSEKGNKSRTLKITKTVENVMHMEKPEHTNPFNNKRDSKSHVFQNKKPSISQKIYTNAAHSEKGNESNPQRNDATDMKNPKQINPFNKKDNKSSVFNNKKAPLSQKSKTKFKPPKTKKFNNAASNSNQMQINDERLKAYNINPRKFHKKQKFGKKSTSK